MLRQLIPRSGCALLSTIIAISCAATEFPSQPTTHRTGEADPAAGGIALVVVDPQGAVVPDARIKLFQDPKPLLVCGFTQPDGTWESTQLAPGTYLLEIFKPGFQDYREPVKIDARKITQLHIDLQVRTAVLVPHQPVEICTNRCPDDLWAVAGSVEQTYAGLCVLVESGRRAASQLRGHLPSVCDKYHPALALRECQSEVDPHPHTESSDTGIMLEVVDPQGAVIPDATIKLFRKASHIEGITGSNGSWRWIGLTPGSYSLEVSRRAFQTHTEEVKIEAGKTTNLEIKLNIGQYSCTVPCDYDKAMLIPVEAPTATILDPIPSIPIPRPRNALRRFLDRLMHVFGS